MSLKDIRSECSDVAGLLQPYVDAELRESEAEHVAAHLEGCDGCRAAVSEQAWVRATLHAIERESAPQALHAKILLQLDEVDREQAALAAASAPPGLGRRLWSRLRDLGRGGLIMVPAGAVAVALFFMAQGGLVPAPAGEAPSPAYGLGSALLPGADPAHGEVQSSGRPAASAEPSVGPAGDEDVMRALAELEPEVGFRVQMPRSSDAPRNLQLVGASLEQSLPEANGPTARLRYVLPSGDVVVDRQVHARAFSPRGTEVRDAGRAYHVRHGATGRIELSFALGDVVHVLSLEEGTTDGQPTRATPERSDYEPLLRFAAHFGGH